MKLILFAILFAAAALGKKKKDKYVVDFAQEHIDLIFAQKRRFVILFPRKDKEKSKPYRDVFSEAAKLHQQKNGKDDVVFAF